MKLSAEEVSSIAEGRGFAPQPVERMIRLYDVLEAFSGDGVMGPRMALVGGTALNAFHADLPRLSLDIDIHYMGRDGNVRIEEERPVLEDRALRITEGKGYSLIRNPRSDTSDRWVFGYEDMQGLEAQLHVDVIYARRPALFGISTLAPPLAPGARAARPGAVHLPTIARGADHDLPPAPLAVEQAPRLANRPALRLAHRSLPSGVDPDAKMPDNAREFGPRDRLVRVRRRGLSSKLCPAPHRSFLRCRPSIRPRPRQRRRSWHGNRIRRWGREQSATAPSVRDGPRIRPSGAHRPPRRHKTQDAGRQRPRHNGPTTGRKTMGAVQWERERFCQKRGQPPKSRPFKSPSTDPALARAAGTRDDHVLPLPDPVAVRKLPELVLAAGSSRQ